MFRIKRNTTPTLEIIVEAPLDLVKKVEFVFKRKYDPDCPELVKKEYQVGVGDGIPVKEGSVTPTEFTVLVKLKAHETMELLAGEVFMDTRVVLTDDDVPDTEVVSGKIKETLFGEVYGDEAD